MGKTSSQVKRKYNEKAYDRIFLSVKKGEKDAVKAYANQVGESLNEFINEAISDRISRLRNEGKITDEFPTNNDK